MMLLHLPNIAAQFKKVNGAIYEALYVDFMPRLLTPLAYPSRSSRAFDEIQSRETPQETAQWAEMYKSFKPSFLSVQGSAIESKLSSITAAIAIPSITATAKEILMLLEKHLKVWLFFTIPEKPLHSHRK